MTDSSAQTVSISVVLFKTSVEDLSRLCASLVIAIAELFDSSVYNKVMLSFIDNSFPDSKDFEDFLEPFFDTDGVHLKYIKGNGNMGFGKAHNLAIMSCESNLHLILNPDVELSTYTLSTMTAYLDTHSNTVAINPYAEDFSGNRQYLTKTYPNLLVLFVRGFLPTILRRPFKSLLAEYEMQSIAGGKFPIRAEILSGCFLICRTKSLQAIGGFDDQFFLYFEDFDLSLRLAELGELIYLPDSKIKHGGGHTAKKGLRHICYFSASAYKFFAKHGFRG